jgi:hypothetical protein
MAFPTQLASWAFPAVVIKVPKTLTVLALSSRGCWPILLYPDTDSTNIEPLPDSSAGVFFSGKSDRD